MEITHNGKTYKVTDSPLFRYLNLCIPEWEKIRHLELIETKPETKYQEAKRKGDIARAKAEILVDNDKAMNIPEEENYKLVWKQLELLTNSLNAVIKKINNL